MTNSSPTKPPYKFTGFLSYCRADGDAVTRLHRRLESFVIPKSLRKDGQKTLGRFFQDKVELAASHEVAGGLTENLDESRFLILCCSSEAGESHWVNEEVKHVLKQRGQQAILAVILRGDSARATFPPALRDNPPLAADLRACGDGEEIGFLKLVAGILDVDLGEIIDRQKAAQRRQMQIRSFLIGLFALLAVAATFSAWQAIQQRDRAEKMALEAIDIGSGVVDRAEELSRTYAVPTEAVQGLLTFAGERFERLFEAGVKNPELERRRAVLLLSFADVAKRTGDVTAQGRYADAAIDHFASLLERKEGLGGYYSRALMSSADAALTRGDDVTGMKHYTDALSILRSSYQDGEKDLGSRQLLAGALYHLGMARLRRKEVDQALPLLEEALPLYEENWKEKPEDDINATNLITCLDSLGGARALNQDLENARIMIEKSIVTARDWIAKSPASLPARSTLALSLMKKAQLQSDTQDMAGAIITFEETIQVSRNLAAKDPGNAILANHLAFRLVLMAQTVQKSGDFKRAGELANEGIRLREIEIGKDQANLDILKSYVEMLRVARSIASDLGDLPGMLSLSKTIAKTTGEIRTLTGNGIEQMKAHAHALEIVGDDSAQNRNLESMLEAYEAAAALRRTILKSDPDSIEARTAIAGTLHALGLTRKFAKQTDGAVAALTEAAETRASLAATNPPSPGLSFAAAESYQQLATLQAGFDGAACEKSMLKAENLLSTLVKNHPENTTYSASLQKTREMLKLIQGASEKTEQ